MTGKLTASLREAPATVPAMAAFALLVVWATDSAGYPVTHWAPGALIVMVLLAIAVGLVGVRAREVPAPVRVALAAFAAYTALSYLSIIWAADRGAALEGADRTLLYLLVFALTATWRQHGRSAVLLLAGWVLALTVIAAIAAVHIGGADAARLQTLLPGGRLTYPSGYANANAAQWLMAFWPALLLARSNLLHWSLRGILAGGAVLLALVALLSQSRGSLYATPVMIVLVFALLPGRTRTFAILVPVAAGIGVAAPSVLAVGDNLTAGLVSAGRVHTAVSATFAAAAVAAVLVAAAAALEGRVPIGDPRRARISRAVGVLAVACLVAGLAGGLALGGNPITRLRHGWDTFKGGYAADTRSASRLTSGLGSNRYDFYRVALDEFTAHPLLGIGADNFQQPYLVHGRSTETPRYPHSVELRVLSQTGLVGALIALVGLGAALLAAWRAVRGPDRLGALVAAAALAGLGYWLVHGSFDWFWEFAGLGGPAFAMLGLACALAPRRAPEAPPARIGRLPRVLVGAGAAAVAAFATLALAGPWLSELEVQDAASIWRGNPSGAYSQLADAARLNPLGDQAYVLAGGIAVRRSELAAARHYFAQALARVPGDAYAALERGAVASALGSRAEAELWLARAARLNPRDELTRQALRDVRSGLRIDVGALNTQILRGGEQFG